MAQTSNPPLTLIKLIQSAQEATEQYYAEAIAAQIEGTGSADYWQRFKLALARSIMLAQVLGMDRVTRLAKMAGAKFAAESFAKADWGLDSDDMQELMVGPFEEAISDFAGKVPMLAESAKEISRGALSMAEAVTAYEVGAGFSSLIEASSVIKGAVTGAFYVTGADRETTLNLKSLVAEVIRGDDDVVRSMSLPEFIDRAQLAGAGNLTRARLETVLRNNVQSAYNAGQVSVLKSGTVAKSLPLVMLVAAKDRRTRGNPSGLYPGRGKHWQMDGFVGTMADFERWGIVPPNGHNCRCTLRPLTVWEIEQKGLGADGAVDSEAVKAHNGDRYDYIQSGEYPDPGWN